eukprot:CAMPEP_0185036272 /NCGR_PEP_ID=MMETSP1103-20130426/28990_1 /TAXON_ID=36769 /ORGANISM="Paraphysomonas bandaiensis, Strain Caron Lab Isolate" /LENGTH=1059 /DNA_ID=CAMNT_0027573757 /DNA_START=43 /DNA_END=3225 /DNA_ORIENTATION=-
MSRPELSYADIDPALRKLQDEWEELLMHDELTVDIPPKLDLHTEENKFSLLALWFDDGVLGWKIDYPNTPFELHCYRFIKSRQFLGIYTVLCFMHICSPFLEEPSCPWNDVKHDRSVGMFNSGGGKYLSPFVVNMFGLICVLAYILEILLRLSINNHKKKAAENLPFYKDNWILFRIIASSILLLDLLVFFGTGRPIRFARALLPFIYISRRNSMRQLMHGLLISFYKSINILMLYLAVLLIWSYVGFILFRKVDTDENNRFVSLPESLLTCLHALTARSWNAFVVNEYFDKHAASGVFFVSLLLFGDLLCTNLVVAVGNRQYRIFATRIFNRQLRNRRQAFVAIHDYLSDRHGYVSREAWMRFCACIQGKYRVNSRLADMLFSLECEKDTAMDATKDTIDSVGLFRLCALISARVDIDPNSNIGEDGNRLESTLRQRESLDIDIGVMQFHWDTSSNSVPLKKDSAGEVDQTPPSMKAAPTEENVFRTTDGGALNLIHSATQGKSHPQEMNAASEASVAASMSTKSSVNSALNMGEDDCGKFTTPVSVKAMMRYIVDFSIRFDDMLPFRLPLLGDRDFAPFRDFFRAIRVVLAVQLVLISGNRNSSEWMRVGWFLEACLWIQMIVLIYAWGFPKYMRRTGYGFIMIINVISLVLMIIVGDDDNNHYSPAFVSLLVVQVLRFLSVFQYMRDSELFISIFPLVLRMFFLLFSVIYFFSVFGHTRLCNAFNEEKIGENADDDSTYWRDNFTHLLNFNTLLQTIYTLFEVSILGNWSIIMDAAAHTERVPSMLFFFTYRMVMAMIVIPLLFAFIMQAFISRRNQDEEAKKQALLAAGGGSDVLKGRRQVGDEGVYQFNKQKIFELTEDLDTIESRGKAIDAAVDNIRRNMAAAEKRIRRDSSDDEHPDIVSPTELPSPALLSTKSNTEPNAENNSPGKKKRPTRRSSLDLASVSQCFQAIADGGFFQEDLAKPEVLRSPSPPPAAASTAAVKVGEKSTSMMSFWSGGETALAPQAIKDKRRVELLTQMLEDALHQLALQKEACRDAQESLDSAKSHKQRSQPK